MVGLAAGGSILPVIAMHASIVTADPDWGNELLWAKCSRRIIAGELSQENYCGTKILVEGSHPC